MSFPSTGLLDNFNRANGAVGANWTKVGSAFSVFNVSGNTAVDSTPAGAFAWEAWVPSTFGPDSECYAKIATVPTAGDSLRLGVRFFNLGGTTQSGYALQIVSGAWTIQRLDNGSSVQLASGVTQNLSIGDLIGIEMIGTVITLYYNSVGGGGWVAKMTYDTAADATKYQAAGSICMELKSGAFDDFSGGNYVRQTVGTIPI